MISLLSGFIKSKCFQNIVYHKITFIANNFCKSEQDLHDFEQDLHDFEQDLHDFEQDLHDLQDFTGLGLWCAGAVLENRPQGIGASGPIIVVNRENRVNPAPNPENLGNLENPAHILLILSFLENPAQNPDHLLLIFFLDFPHRISYNI